MVLVKMRAFILICVLSTALTAPQGYNYQQNTGLTRTLSTDTSATGTTSFLQEKPQGYNYQQNTGLSGLTRTLSTGTSTTGTSGTSTIVNTAPSFLQEALRSTQLTQSLLSNQNTQQQQHHHGGTVQIPTTTLYQPPLRTQQQQTLSTYNTAQAEFNAARQSTAGALITKDIYVHVAPDDPTDNIPAGPALPPPPPRKHYRIVFIKAPAPSFSSAGALQVKQAPVEEKTIIYVLTKKTDSLDLQQAIQEVAPKQPSKPEVYFIKYKTQEEAQHAQRTIQAQYDQLGGTTQVSDEGFAPVTSVIGALDQQQRGSIATQPGTATLTTTNINTSSSANALVTSNIGGAGNTNQYLPPIKH